MTNATYMRTQAIQTFERVHSRARWANLWHRLRGQTTTLLSYEAVRRRLPAGTVLDKGVQEISVAAIVGSVGRASDFDPSFRPLNKGLCARWVGVSRLQETVGWEPIAAIQIGSYYFVADGHHRASVAQAAGLPTIEAWISTLAVGLGRDKVDALVTHMLDSALRPTQDFIHAAAVNSEVKHADYLALAGK